MKTIRSRENVLFIVCDWNRTLLKDAYELTFFTGLARAVFLKHIGMLNIERAIAVLRAKKRCMALLSHGRRDTQTYVSNSVQMSEVIELLNAEVIKGMSTRTLDGFINAYAIRARKRLDLRLLACLGRLRDRFGTPIVIVSSGCKPAIKRTLELEGFPIDLICANEFETHGPTVEAFRLSIYGNKDHILRSLAEERRIPLNRVAFIGDDWEDRRCFEIVGLPMVSFFASRENRQLLVKEARALAPRDESELESLLMRATATGISL